MSAPVAGAHLLGRATASTRGVVALIDWRSVLAFALPFALYLRTLAPTIYNLDSAELTTAAATGGLMRATGYPLYLLIGRLWSRLPFGDVGYRMNLFSAFCGALTILLAERILRRRRVGPAAAFGALGLLATAPQFWSLSLIAEVYTLHTVLMAGIILALLRWGEQPTPGRFGLIGLLGGLGMAHHLSTALLVPGCLFYALAVAPRRAIAPRALLLATLGALAGLSLYLYLPLRYAAQPAFNYAGLYDTNAVFQPVDLRTPDGLWSVVSGRAFAEVMMGYTPAQFVEQTGWFGVHLWRAFFGVGIGPGLVGLALQLRRDWRLGGAMLLLFVCNAAFFINYKVIDKDTFFLPAFLIWALWLALGYQWLLGWLRGTGARPAQRRAAEALAGLMIGAVLVALGWNWPLLDRSHDWSARERGAAILRQVRPNALVLGWWDTAPVAQYLQLVEGQRPDVLVINRFLVKDAAFEGLVAREIAARPIYIDTPPDELPAGLELRPAGELYRLSPRVPH